jgi:hypothetical protein
VRPCSSMHGPDCGAPTVAPAHRRRTGQQLRGRARDGCQRRRAAGALREPSPSRRRNGGGSVVVLAGVGMSLVSLHARRQDVLHHRV